MYKRLVKLDPLNGWRFCEVDPIRLRRTAAALKAFVEREISPELDEYDIRGQVLPLCENALNGPTGFPLVFADLPLKYLSREGMLPEGMGTPWSEFCLAATGAHLEKPDEVTVDGERYAYMEFEEPGDWPDAVLHREEERRRRLLAEPD